MNLTESFLTALDSIAANKMRAILTMLGVIIGVASVIALMAIGNGFSDNITNEINSIGTNLISISTDFDNSDGYSTLTMEDVDAVANPSNVPAAAAVGAVVQGQRPVAYGRESLNATVSGVTPNYMVINNLDEYQLGDGLTENDNATGARVAVLGAGVAGDLFGTAYPVGKPIRISGVNYEVVGVLPDSGGGIGGFTDDNIYIPLATALSRIYTDRTRQGQKAIGSISVQAASSDQVNDAIDQITATLRERHGIVYGNEDDFIIFDQSSLLDTVNTVTASLTAFLGAIAAISLIVGGIGIMNIMLVSVTERTREIGIRKAIGAYRRDILVQFLLESMVLSLLGGLLGIGLGWLISRAASTAFDINTIVDLGTIALSASFAAAVGLIFGIYPAWRASNLQPIEALRYE